VLCYLEGKTRDEAAREVGWSLGTLRGRLDRGRELLRHRLTRRGVTLPAALFAIGLTQSTAPAAVPLTLVGATVKAGSAFAVGSVTGAFGISARVAPLAQGVLKTMFVSKAKAVGSMLGMVLVAGTIVKQLPLEDHGHRGSVQVVAFTPDGSRVASGGADGSIRFWDVTTMRQIDKFVGQADRAVSSLAFARSGNHLASGSDDGSLDLWDLVERRRQLSIARSSAPIGSIALSADSRVLISGRQDGIVEWTPTADTAEEPPRDFHAERGGISCMAFSPDGKSIAWGMNDGRVTIFDVETRQLKAIHAKHQQGVTALAFSTDGWMIASGGQDGTLKLWPAGCGIEQATFQGHHGPVRAVAISGDRLATGGDDQMVRVWDTRTGEQREVYSGHTGAVLAVAFSPGGDLVASGSADQSVKLWDRPTNLDASTR
jgi:WD40 repeat protein